MTKEVFERLLNEKQYKAIKSIFDTMNPVDTAVLLPEFEDDKSLVMLFRLIPKENAAMVFTYMEPEQQQVLLETFTDRELKTIMDDMFIDDTVDIIEEMPANVVERILSAAGGKRAAINTILNYPEDSAGSIMTLEYVSLAPTMTIGDALKKIKSRGVHSETVNVCYVIEKHKLLGTVTAMDLLICDDDDLLSDVMEENPISVKTLSDKEEVAQLFNKYDVVSLPVVDNENCMVGIVTFDDAIDVIQEEAEEDFQKMAAIAPTTDKPYLKISVWELWKGRIPWLIFLMLSATFTGMIISSFEDALSKIVVLTAFIPMLMGTGGNSGSQASVTVIRGLSLGEIDVRDILRVLWKEIRVSVLCGVSLAIACFVKIIFIDGMLLKTPGVTNNVALVVALTLCLTVICAKVIGCVLPIIAKKMKLDPAVMASPFITTVVDGVSLLVYFGIAKAFLPELM
ncbi:MAG: magnesium transporter [Clostridia bacterium]|nr:magnesium transporter [Clostridia bacterium]MBQ6838737.1 magnesium transporter [Clostridia bacterium]